jgi:hypothetical protein
MSLGLIIVGGVCSSGCIAGIPNWRVLEQPLGTARYKFLKRETANFCDSVPGIFEAGEAIG